MLATVLASAKKPGPTVNILEVYSEFTNSTSSKCMSSVCQNSPKSSTKKIRQIEEGIWQEIGIPYRVINIAAGDLGAPAAKKYDIEYWSPVNQKYQELTSCSNCTDFQARSLNIRVRRNDGKVEVLHTLNGTAISLARTMVAILENYAQKDGKLKIPTVLQPYLGGATEL